MSRPRPSTGGAPRPGNTVVLLRDAYLTLNDLAIVRLAERGHDAVRPAHGAVFQYLDDTGTTVSTLAARAEMTKQAMAELVAHLERHGSGPRPGPDRPARQARPAHRGGAGGGGHRAGSWSPRSSTTSTTSSGPIGPERSP